MVHDSVSVGHMQTAIWVNCQDLRAFCSQVGLKGCLGLASKGSRPRFRHETAPTRRRHIRSPGNGTPLDDQCFSASIIEKWHVAINLVVYLPYLFRVPVH